MGNVTCELMNGRILLDDFTDADHEAVDNRSKAVRLIRDWCGKKIGLENTLNYTVE